MLKKLVCMAFVLLVGVGMALADEAKGKIKSIEKGLLTIDVSGKDTEFKIGKATKVFDGDTEVTGKDRGKAFKAAKENGSEVTVIYDKADDKITVKEVKIKK